ncbi:MAG: PDZ domain-containing protein, partial [Candidatus Thiodiazotropha sp.]
KPPQEVPVRLVLGAKSVQKGDAVLLQQVFDHGAAQAAGLSAGDEVIAVDGLRLNAGGMENYIAQTPAGQSFTIHAFRRDELMQFEVTPLPAPADTCWFHLIEPLDETRRIRSDSWLQGYASRN